jgi:ABC-2 type transporter/Luciferase-like monooxygenase
VKLSASLAPGPHVLEYARHAEELGYDRIWLYDSPLLYWDCCTSLTQLAAGTSRIGIGVASLHPGEVKHVQTTGQRSPCGPPTPHRVPHADATLVHRGLSQRTPPIATPTPGCRQPRTSRASTNNPSPEPHDAYMHTRTVNAHKTTDSQLNGDTRSAPTTSPERRPGRHRQRPPRRPTSPPRPPKHGGRQFFTLARRQLRLLVADRGYFLFLVVLPFILGTLALLVPGRGGLGVADPRGPVPDEPAQILMLLNISAVFMGTALTIRDLVGERAIFRREQSAGLSASAYLLAKIGVYGIAATVQTAILAVIVLIGKGTPTRGAVVLTNSAAELYITLAVTALIAAVNGMALSAAARSQS